MQVQPSTKGALPDELASSLQAANELIGRRQWASAELLLRELERSWPGCLPLLQLQAQALVGTGRIEDALTVLDRACRTPEAPATLHQQYGCLLAHAGRYNEAVRELDAATRLSPGTADCWYFLGAAQLQRGAATAAIPALRHAASLLPEDPRIQRALAEAEFRGGHPLDALPHWERQYLANPGDVDIALRYGETLSRLGQSDQAGQTYARLLARQPDSAGLWLARAQAEEESGQRERAVSSYRQALQLRPGWPFAMAGLIGLLRGDAPDDLLAAARSLLETGQDIAAEERARVGYAIGKHFDAIGDHAAAIRSWHEANAQMQQAIGGYDSNAVQETLRRATRQHAHPVAEAEGAGCEDDRLVFVVGMPRSGTTLTEQILAAHPLAHGCGELPDMALIAHPLSSPGTHMLVPDASRSRLDDVQAAQAASRYLAAATRLAPEGVRRLVDKAPTNYSLLGLIARLFPNSRIIWCRRDPRDIAVSIYGEHFAHSEAYATSLQGIGDCIHVHNELMQHWQNTLPLPVLELHYENLVSAPDVQVRRVLEFLDLPWHESCLSFHAQSRNVQTPSRWQVRQPVHTRSIGRWRHYAAELPEALGALVGPGS